MKVVGEHGFVLGFYLTLLTASVAGFKGVCNMEQLDISGTLTCKFEMDLGQLKHDFSVQHYSPEDDVIPDPVLRCIFRKDSEHPECEVEDGYKFDENSISNVITLKIPKLKSVHQGWYICQVLPTIKEDNDTKPCNEANCKPSVQNDSTDVALIIVVVTTVVAFATLVVILLWALVKHRCKLFGMWKDFRRTEKDDATMKEPMNQASMKTCNGTSATLIIKPATTENYV